MDRRAPGGSACQLQDAHWAIIYIVKKLTLRFTPEELKVLTTLVSDQLFRREFIDPKIPGFKQNTGELELGKSLIGRLRSAAGQNDSKTDAQPKRYKRRS